jgi:hypothetical protein
MRLIAALSLAAGLTLGTAVALAGGEPWEIKTAGGYLSGDKIVPGASRAEKFDERPRRGVQPFLAYDRAGKSPLVGRGAANLWEFEYRGPDAVYIRAAEGKWKGYYLRTSDRAFRDGPTFGFLLELGKQPQTFYVYQVGK